MAAERGQMATPVAGESDAPDKTPRTERGRKTLRALLDAAADEFGDKGFHEGVDQRDHPPRRASRWARFYTYFDSKDAIFRALVRDMSDKVREHVTPRLQGVARRARRRARRAGGLPGVRARTPGSLPDHR